MQPEDIVIPADLLPGDGRFGSGPSKVRPAALDALAATGRDLLGTSHRQAAVRGLVGRFQDNLRTFFALPDDYEVVLGNGGTTICWDAQVFGLIEERSQHVVFGEFSSKFADAVRQAPHLDDPEVIEAEPGGRAEPRTSDVDTYALIHNETSTGVAAEVQRPGDGIVTVDATSGAGGLPVDPSAFDFYYFAPQKTFASDGGLWVALCSPAALERIDKIACSGRFIPAGISLQTAVENSRKQQTYNTPAVATLFLANHQLEWMLEGGGLSWAVDRCNESASILYAWADAHERAWPFVKDPDHRSNTVVTIDFADEIDAAAISKALRSNGIVDTEPYRKLGRNQLRVAVYPAVDPEDVRALVGCIDHVMEVMDADS